MSGGAEQLDAPARAAEQVADGIARLRALPTVDASPARESRDRPAASDERSRFWRDALRRRMLAISDFIAAVLAAAVIAPDLADLLWALVCVPAWLVIAKLIGLYDRDHSALRHLTLDEVGSIAAWAAAGTALTTVVLPLTSPAEVSTGDLFAGWACAFGACFVLRAAARAIWRRVTPPDRTIVLGHGLLADAMRRKLTLFRDMHLTLARDEGDGPDLPGGIDRVIVATQDVDSDLVAELVGVCRERGVKLSVVSPLRGRSRPSAGLSQVADLPILEYETWDVSRSTALIKRAFDLVVGGVGLIVTAPLWPLIALAIKLESRGPVIFAQTRAGFEGEPFRMYKFRTMVRDAEARLPEVVRLDELNEPAFKIDGDPRITRAGAILRRLSLDEIPQLINVLRGDMSIVGPRPEQVELVERYRPEHRFRLQVKPGMTGPMQVFGRGELSFPERLAVELDYVEHVSLTRDLRILAETIPAIFRGTGAY